MKNTVRLLRKEKHWSQDQLAARVGVSHVCIDAIEKERFLPSITLAYNIAFALDKYVVEVFPPQEHGPCPSPHFSGFRPERQGMPSRESAFQSGGAR